MLYKLLADAVAVFHLLFVAFAVLGGLLALGWRWIPWLHLPALAWGATVEFAGWICPLTPLENWLRVAGGVAVTAVASSTTICCPCCIRQAWTANCSWC